MRYTFLTTVAAAALALGAQVAAAQTSQSQGSSSEQIKRPPLQGSSGASDTAPGQSQNRPSVSSESPGKSETAPGQNRPTAQTDAPGKSESAPGQNRSSAQTDAPGKSESAPGQAQRQNAKGSSSSDPNTGSTAVQSGSSDPQKRPPQAAQPSKGAQTGSSSQSATGQQNQGAPQPSARSQQNPPQTQGSTTTQNSNSIQGSSSTQSSSSQQTGSSNTFGSGVVSHLDTEKRSEVTRAFTSTSVNTTSDVNFDVSVGSRITENVRLAPVPQEVVRIVPQYRGYDYVVVRDEIVIVEPKTKKVVEVIHKSGGPSRKSAAVNLSSEQRRKFKTTVETTGSTRRASQTIELREGITLPQDIELQEVPDTFITEVPEIREYRYVVIGDEIGLVDPGTRQVIEVFQE
jgi:hypothetical protein